jgi:hypothetical protein
MANFNNSTDGGDRIFEVTITAEQAQQIINYSGCKITLQLKCKYPTCHTGIIHAEVTLSQGKSIICGDDTYSGIFISSCIPMQGRTELIFCPPESCSTSTSSTTGSTKCLRMYDSIYSPISDIALSAGITTEGKLRVWGDVKYDASNFFLKEWCNCEGSPGESLITLKNDMCGYNPHRFDISCPTEICSAVSSSSSSSSSSSTACKSYKYVSMTKNVIGLIDSNSKLEFIPKYRAILSYDGECYPTGDFSIQDYCNFVDCTKTYTYISVGNATLDNPYEVGSKRLTRTLLVDTEGNVSTNSTGSPCEINYLNISDAIAIDVYSNTPELVWHELLYNQYRTSGAKAIQADFSDYYRIVRFDNGKILINSSDPQYYFDSYSNIGVTDSLTDPTWKNKTYKFINVYFNTVVAITTAGEIEVYGYDVDDVWGLFKRTYFGSNLNEINSKFTDIKKIIFRSDMNIAFCLRETGEIMIFSHDTSNEVYSSGFYNNSNPSDPEYSAWEKKTVAGSDLYYFGLSSSSYTKFKDFTVTKLSNYDNISLIGIADTTNPNTNKRTICYGFTRYFSREGQPRIGLYGEANCCIMPPTLVPTTTSSSSSSSSSSSQQRPCQNTGGGATTNVVSWGSNQFGQTSVLCANFVDIAAGQDHTIGVTTAGTVLAWGRDWEGSVSGIPSGLSNVSKVATGSYHSMALTTNKQVVCWGKNASGQCNVPVNAQSGVTQIEGGHIHSLALKENGDVIQWGGAGALEPVPSGLKAKKITAGRGWSMAITTSNTVVAWGWLDGIGPHGELRVPAPLQNGSKQVIEIAGSRHHALALTSDGVVYAWGAGVPSAIWITEDYNQCEMPNYTLVAEPDPQYGPGYTYGLSNVVKIYAGWKHSVALKNDGTLVFWGTNSFGVLDNPYNIVGPIKFAAGQSHNAAILP